MQNQNYEKLSLETLDGGAAIDQANSEIARVVRNCLDDSTEIAKAREVKLIIKISPTDDRKALAITYQATSKLAPEFAGSQVAVLDQDGIAHVSTMQQMDLDGTEREPARLVPRQGEN